MSYKDRNLMVYVKIKDSKKFSPLSSLKDFTVTNDLMYACLLPFEKLQALKEWANEFSELSIKEGVTIQIRSSRDRKKVFHQIN